MAVLGLAWGLGIWDRAGVDGISCVKALCLVFSDMQLKLPASCISALLSICPKHLSFGVNGTLPLT